MYLVPTYPISRYSHCDIHAKYIGPSPTSPPLSISFSLESRCFIYIYLEGSKRVRGNKWQNRVNWKKLTKNSDLVQTGKGSVNDDRMDLLEPHHQACFARSSSFLLSSISNLFCCSVNRSQSLLKGTISAYMACSPFNFTSAQILMFSSS